MAERRAFPGPIFRRRLGASARAALGAIALPAGVVEAVAAEVPSAAGFEAMPAVFDPAAFCNDLIDAGFRITASRPVPMLLDDEEDLRPSYVISPPPGRGFGRAYCEVMRRWSDAMDACPDHVEQVVAYAFGQLDDRP